MADESQEREAQAEKAHRALSPTTNPTSEECYTYCSIEYTLQPPFYFQLKKTSDTTADCYCW